MKTWIKVLIITFVVGIPAFFIGPLLWTPHPDVKPTPVQFPFFMFLSAVESLALGIGVAFLIFGWPLVKKASSDAKNRTLAMYISIAWLLVSWWPHDNWHIHNGLNEQGLLYIDYTFHMTIIITSFILAYYFIFNLQESTARMTKSEK